MKKAPFLPFLPFLAMCFIATASGFAFWPFDSGKKKEEEKKPAAVEQKKEPPRAQGGRITPARRAQLVTSFAPVIQKVTPSVVSVFTIKNLKLAERPFPFFDDPNIQRFFPPDSEQDFQAPQSHRDREVGSGLILSEDGYIVTNFHVIEHAEEIKISLPNGEKNIPAKIIGTDEKTDLAVLKIERAGLPVPSFANSEHVRVGDIVLVIGNPFGLSQSVTMGIVSALGRDNVGVVPDGYEDFIQTDASINPGNSGGPLTDSRGRVVGISTAIYSQSGGNQGIGFAVPINFVRTITQQIIRYGRVVRGYMGISIQPLSKDLAEAFQIPTASGGALIGEVSPDSPAAQAGLKEGDVITSFNNTPVTSPHQLRLAISQNPPGTQINFQIIRDGKLLPLTVTLRELAEEKSPQPATAAAPVPKSGDDALQGVQIANLDLPTRRQLDIPENIQGALVKNVAPDSPASDIGVRPGDIIMEINRTPVANAKEAEHAAKKIQTDRVLLRIWRNSARYIVLPIRKKE